MYNVIVTVVCYYGVCVDFLLLRGKTNDPDHEQDTERADATGYKVKEQPKIVKENSNNNVPTHY